jgi:hypothetical protein
MIDMRFVVLPTPEGNYIRVGGKACQLQYRLRMGESVGWWIPVRIEEQLPTDKMQPFHEVEGMTDLQRLEAHDFHKTLEKA